MAISYEEALATLESMFSDQGYTAQQLDAVLRHHGGHMEHTVETFLMHGGGTPDELMQKLPSIPVGGGAVAAASSNNNGGGGGDAQHNIDADEELARQLAAEDERQQQQQQRGRSNSRQTNRSTNQSSERGMGLASAMGAFPGQRRPMASTVTAPAARKPAARKPASVPPAAAFPKPPAGTRGRGTATVLPFDFLRIPGRKYPAASTSTSSSTTQATTASNSNNAISFSDPIASASGPGGMGQMMSDEQLARMLQDELFQEELRNNPEFSHLAGGGSRRNPSARSVGGRAQTTTTGRSNYASGAGGGRGGGIGWGERTDFFDRISDLGDNAKRRFQTFAAGWNDPNAQSSRASRPALFGGSGGAAAESNTANRGNERRGLLDLAMDEEEEELDFVGGNNSNAFEMNDVSGNGDKKKD